MAKNSNNNNSFFIPVVQQFSHILGAYLYCFSFVAKTTPVFQGGIALHRGKGKGLDTDRCIRKVLTNFPFFVTSGCTNDIKDDCAKKEKYT